MPDIRVTFFGDSLVAGVGDESGLGWPGRLVAAAASAGTPVCAYNLGVRRETSADVLARWESELAPRLESGAESRLVFSFGVNDATWEDGEPRVRPAQSAAHLDRVLDRARAWSLPALVVGPPPVADDAQRERIAALSVAFGHVTAERGGPLRRTGRRPRRVGRLPARARSRRRRASRRQRLHPHRRAGDSGVAGVAGRGGPGGVLTGAIRPGGGVAWAPSRRPAHRRSPRPPAVPASSSPRPAA